MYVVYEHEKASKRRRAIRNAIIVGDGKAAEDEISRRIGKYRAKGLRVDGARVFKRNGRCAELLSIRISD